MGSESSGSFGNMKQDFMVDLVPRVQMGILPNLQVMGEIAIGILQDKNNDRVRVGAYTIMGF